MCNKPAEDKELIAQFLDAYRNLKKVNFLGQEVFVVAHLTWQNKIGGASYYFQFSNKSKITIKTTVKELQ